MDSTIRHRIERYGRESISILDDATAGHFHFTKPGWLRGIAWASSDYASSATFVITITDDEGSTLFTSDALAHNSAGYIATDVLIANTAHTVTATTGDPGVGGATITIALLMLR
jgi:hypothetical protein